MRQTIILFLAYIMSVSCTSNEQEHAEKAFEKDTANPQQMARFLFDISQIDSEGSTLEGNLESSRNITELFEKYNLNINTDVPIIMEHYTTIREDKDQYTIFQAELLKLLQQTHQHKGGE